MLPTIGNATLCGDPRPFAEISVVEVQKLEFFAFFDIPARPSAEIGVVEVQKLEFFLCFLTFPRATLCGDRRGRGAKTQGFLRFLTFPRDPLRRSCVSKRSRCDAVLFSANPLRRSWLSKRSRCGAARFCCSRNLEVLSFAIPRSRV